MVKIEQSENRVSFECTECEISKTFTTNWPLKEVDAILGLCPDCFGDVMVAKIRAIQRAEGNFDCFCKSEAFCDQYLCKFRTNCLKMERRP